MDDQRRQPQILQLDDEGEEDWEVDAVLNHKKFKKAASASLYIHCILLERCLEDRCLDQASGCKDSVQESLRQASCEGQPIMTCCCRCCPVRDTSLLHWSLTYTQNEYCTCDTYAATANPADTHLSVGIC